MAIAQFPGFVIDCPDARVLADFYGALLDWEAKGDAEWAEIRPADGSGCISFQQVAGFTAPQWPGQDVPQQMHLDVVVEDLDAAERPTADLGGDQGGGPAEADDVPGVPRPGRAPVLPLRRLRGQRLWKSIPSATSWSSSIATSPPPLAERVGPSHRAGWAACAAPSEQTGDCGSRRAG